MSKTTVAKKAKKVEETKVAPVATEVSSETKVVKTKAPKKAKVVATESPAVVKKAKKEKVTPVTPSTPVVSKVEPVEGSELKKSTKKSPRSKKYLEAKKKVDANKLYKLAEAVALAKEVNYAKFSGKLEAHLMTIHTPGNIGEIIFPHLEAVAKKIAILNDAILAELKDNKVNFDILVATPATMPKLLPFARLLGPKGLMPNPKNGTLTDKPEEAVKKLSVAKLVVKTEKTAPVIHITVGKLEQKDAELVANIEELIKVVNPLKLKKLVLAPTMGPGIKVQL